MRSRKHMYPWAEDRRVCLGRDKPTGRMVKEYTRFGAMPFRSKGWWYAEFSPEELRRFNVHVLYHELGHHVDWYYRHWSKANRRVTEEAAEQYAMGYSKTGAEVLQRMDQKARGE